MQQANRCPVVLATLDDACLQTVDCRHFAGLIITTRMAPRFLIKES